MDMIVVKGGGDIASGVVCRLFLSGYKVVVLEIEKPTAIRRAVSFSEAVYVKRVNIEGIEGVLAEDFAQIEGILEEEKVPVFVDDKGIAIERLKPVAVVDAIIAKENLGTNKDMAPITIGIGPGFEAGKDVDIVVESQRGHDLGRVIYNGRASKNTGIPGEIKGYREERILRAPCEGIVKAFYNIGDEVKRGDIICQTGIRGVKAQIDGILRGMIKEGLTVNEGLKIGDIDPRGVREYAFTVSDKARAIGGGVLEGIEHLKVKMLNRNIARDK